MSYAIEYSMKSMQDNNAKYTKYVNVTQVCLQEIVFFYNSTK